jgi:3-hydroxybutyryl-CoA dehydrogenase
MSISKIAVIGAGTMGNGIAHVFAQHDFETYLCDLNKNILDRALCTISANLDKQIKKGILQESSKNEILKKINITSNLKDIPGDVDLIIEAIIENKNAKICLFKELESIIDPKSIFASNTSSISITEMGSASRPDRFIGMHFMNPVPVMKLVEIIRGYSTSNETYNAINDLSKKLEKESVVVKDYPGFISNRILMPMINEAIFSLYEGVASAEDIDTVMKLGMNHPMGPLTLADFIGLDVCLNIMEVLYNGFNDSKYRPCPLLKKMVESGNLGRKTGKGFFEYR